jgi:putative transposase
MRESAFRRVIGSALVLPLMVGSKRHPTEAKAGIGKYFAFYNERRLHQALGYRVPMAVWREGAPPKADGYVDNANALTTCAQADQKQQQTEPLAA